MVKKEKGFAFGQMVMGCILVAFVSVFVCIMSQSLIPSSFKGYETVSCRIVRSSVKMENVNRFIFTAEFSYEHNGRTYTSNSLRKPGQNEFEFNRIMARLPLLEKYASGTEHECRVNQKNPFDAVLAVENPVEDPDALPGNTGSIVAGMLLLFVLLAGIGMIATAFPSVRRLLKTLRMKKTPVAIGLVLFGCPFMIVGSFGLVRDVRERSEAKAYVPVPAKVLYSGMYSFRSGGRGSGTSYNVRVGYEYTVGGKKYEGDRLTISQVSSSNYNHHRYLADKYRKGDAVTAYVSPNDPQKSVLERSGGLGGIGAMVFSGLFVVVGFAIIVAGLWTLFSLMRRRNGAPLSFERRTLKRSYADTAAAGLVAALWNVFSWSFVLGFVGEEQVKRLEPMLLVLATFPLAGIFLTGVFIWKIVRELQAPRLVLTLSCAVWKHGSPAQIDWSLENQEEIESLEIVLVRKRAEGSGKHRRLTTVSSQNCCCYARSMVPGAGSFGFTVPEGGNDGSNFAFVATVKVKSVRRVFTLTYPLPNPIV